jgi:hypothetical protein
MELCVDIAISYTNESILAQLISPDEIISNGLRDIVLMISPVLPVFCGSESPGNGMPHASEM